jgi:hypothetical protein
MPQGIEVQPAQSPTPQGIEVQPQGLEVQPLLPTPSARRTPPVRVSTTYDKDIIAAAQRHHIDPNLLRLVGYQETQLGTSAMYDPKTGLSRMRGNAGHGIWQLDPASGASQQDLDRAARDPAFAADYAAKMISNLLHEYGGNVREALRHYGPGGVGYAYADSVLGRALYPALQSALVDRQHELALEHNRRELHHFVAGGSPEAGGFVNTVHNIATSIGHWFASALGPKPGPGPTLQERQEAGFIPFQGPAARTPYGAPGEPSLYTPTATMTPKQRQLYFNQQAREAQGVSTGMLDFAAAWDAAGAEEANSVLRNLSADPKTTLAAQFWPTLGNIRAAAKLPGSQALHNTLLNPKLTLNQKLLAGFNELGVDSPGETAYYSQLPSLHDIWFAHAKTPQGKLMATIMSPRAELARLRMASPWFAGAETAGLEMFNIMPLPLTAGAGAVVRGVLRAGGDYAFAFRAGAEARNVQEAQAAQRAADATRRSWKFKQQSTALMVPEQDLGIVRAGQPAGPLATHSPLWATMGPEAALPGRASLPGEAGQLALPKPPEGPVPAPLRGEPEPEGPGAQPGEAQPSGEPFSLGVRGPREPYTQSERRLTAKGVFTPSGAISNMMFHLGQASPSAMRHLTASLGKGFDKLAAAYPSMIGVGDRYFHFGKVYGPVGEWMAANFVGEQANARLLMRNNAMAFDMYGGLSTRDQELLHFTIDNLPDLMRGKFTQYPDILTPRGEGPSILERALNHNDISVYQYHELMRLDPTLAKLFRKPETIDFSHPATVQTNLSRAVQQLTGRNQVDVIGYAPRYTTYPNTELQDILGGGAGGGLGGMSKPYKRTLGPLDQVIEKGMTLSGQWNPAGDSYMKWAGVENYLTMLRQYLDTGAATVVPGLRAGGRNVHAVEPLPFIWPGGKEYEGTVINWEGAQRDLSKPIAIGSGPEGYGKLNDFFLHVGKSYMEAHPGAGDLNHALYGMVTQLAQERLPEFEVRPGQILSSSGLNGYMVERAYFHQVADANPRVAYNLGMDGMRPVMRESLGRIQQAHHELDVSAQRAADAHFITDNQLENYYDRQETLGMVDSMARQAAMLNFGYHVPMNSVPGVWYVLAQAAKNNPVKLARWSGGLMKAMGAALWHSGEDLARDGLISRLPSKPPRPQSQTPLWLEHPEWIDRAEAYNLFSRGISSGLRTSEYIRLMATPWSDLSDSDRFLRNLLLVSNKNKEQVFHIQEPSVLAYGHHVLVDEEGIDPRIAARMLQKGVNDYDNITGPERAARIGNWMWFYTFGKMQMKRSFNLMRNAPQIPLGVGTGVYRMGQTAGMPNPSSKTLPLYRKPDGSYVQMSVPFGPQRYAEDANDLLFGGADSTMTTAAQMLANHLTPPASFGVRTGISVLDLMRRGEGHTPEAFSVTSGAFDSQADFWHKLEQAGQMLAWRITPYGMFNAYNPPPPALAKKFRQIAGDIRIDALRMKKAGADPKTIQQGIDYAERLDNDDATAYYAAMAWAARNKAPQQSRGLIPSIPGAGSLLPKVP